MKSILKGLILACIAASTTSLANAGEMLTPSVSISSTNGMYFMNGVMAISRNPAGTTDSNSSLRIVENNYGIEFMAYDGDTRQNYLCRVSQSSSLWPLAKDAVAASGSNASIGVRHRGDGNCDYISVMRSSWYNY